MRIILQTENGTLVVVIVWKLDLQLPMQPLPILTIAVSSNPSHGEVYLDTTLCVVSDLRQVAGFLRIVRFPPIIKVTATI